MSALVNVLSSISSNPPALGSSNVNIRPSCDGAPPSTHPQKGWTKSLLVNLGV